MIFDYREPPWFERKIKNLINFKIKYRKTHPDGKAIIFFNFTIDIFKISLTQKLINLKGNITRIYHVRYLIEVSISKDTGFF